MFYSWSWLTAFICKWQHKSTSLSISWYFSCSSCCLSIIFKEKYIFLLHIICINGRAFKLYCAWKIHVFTQFFCKKLKIKCFFLEISYEFYQLSINIKFCSNCSQSDIIIHNKTSKWCNLIQRNLWHTVWCLLKCTFWPKYTHDHFKSLFH